MYSTFLPLARSLEDDAPGYVDATSSAAAVGPSCWKCSGTGKVRRARPSRRERKRARKEGTVVASAQPAAGATQPCSICKGAGRLAPKKEYHDAAPRAGRITDASRRRSDSWTVRGPPAAFSAAAALGGDAGVAALPAALRPRTGEGLCCLTGDWRVYQRDGGHRWSTDDMVTSWVAGRVLRDVLLPAAAAAAGPSTPLALRYLDLGCGIGSVLMMTAWQALTYAEECSSASSASASTSTTTTSTAATPLPCPPLASLECVGVEARSEAVDQARRSIAFNVGSRGTMRGAGDVAASITVQHGDFRSAVEEAHAASSSSSSTPTRGDDGFDLVTGTPPYFEVQFDVGTGGEAMAVTCREGSLPSCKQSAPARCEFRGGIESYCAAAAAMLSKKPHARFVVCEGSLTRNRARVINAARVSGFAIDRVVDVIGKAGKDPLFAVFVMRRWQSPPSIATAASGPDAASLASPPPPIHERVLVRDANGARTAQYRALLLTMGCPP